MAAQRMKPYMRLASGLVIAGAAIFTIERYGLSEVAGPSRIHIDPNLLAALVLAPMLMVAAGAIIFIYGKLRKL